MFKPSKDLPFLPVKEGQSYFFQFENDFIENNVRCIPMIVRFKLDACGIKLKLAEWSKFSPAERNILVGLPCVTDEETANYYFVMHSLIFKRTGNNATELNIDFNPPWSNILQINSELKEKAFEFGCEINLIQWSKLNNLQRFALLKLCRSGHENKNFPVAMKEFGLM